MCAWHRLHICAHRLLWQLALTCKHDAFNFSLAHQHVPDGCLSCRAELSRTAHDVFTYLGLGHTVYTCTLTNRKWCQTLSPGRQRWLLRYRDSGFLFLSFCSALLSHGLTQIDTSPSVAGVHPSHSLITGRPSEPSLASLYLPLPRSLSPSPSISRYLTCELLAPVWAHKFFSISFIKGKNVHIMNNRGK